MIKRHFFLIFLLNFLCFPLLSEEVHLVSLEWPPYTGKELPDQGIFTKQIREYYKKKDITLKITFLPWPRALELTRNGVFDAIFPEYFAKAREKDFVYSKSFLKGPATFVYKENKSFKPGINFHKLDQYKIGVVRGYINFPQLDQNQKISKTVVSSDIQNIDLLLNDRVDSIFIDTRVFSYLLKKNFKIDSSLFKFYEPLVVEHDLYLLISKKSKNKELLLK